MQEANVKPGGALSNATRGKSHALGAEPFDRQWKVINPKTDMIQRRSVN